MPRRTASSQRVHECPERTAPARLREGGRTPEEDAHRREERSRRRDRLVAHGRHELEHVILGLVRGPTLLEGRVPRGPILLRRLEAD